MHASPTPSANPPTGSHNQSVSPSYSCTMWKVAPKPTTMHSRLPLIMGQTTIRAVSMEATEQLLPTIVTQHHSDRVPLSLMLPLPIQARMYLCLMLHVLVRACCQSPLVSSPTGQTIYWWNLGTWSVCDVWIVSHVTSLEKFSRSHSLQLLHMYWLLTSFEWSPYPQYMSLLCAKYMQNVWMHLQESPRLTRRISQMSQDLRCQPRHTLRNPLCNVCWPHRIPSVRWLKEGRGWWNPSHNAWWPCHVPSVWRLKEGGGWWIAPYYLLTTLTKDSQIVSQLSVELAGGPAWRGDLLDTLLCAQ